MDRRLVIGIVTGCGAIIVCGLGALILGGTWIGSSIKEPTDIVVDVNAPLEIKRGQGFLVIVTITNTATKAQELDSIDIADEYLEGIAVERSDPTFSESYEIFGYQTYEYMRQIPADGEIVVRFFMFPLRSGDFSGDIDICVNGPAKCLTRSLRTMVRE